MSTTRQQRQQIQARISPADVEFLARLHPQQSEALRRAIDLARLSVEASRNPDPAAQLAYYLDRAAATLATMRSHPAPPTLAGSTTTPTQAAPLYKGGAAPGQPAAPAADGFEGWDE